jgi:hypothetical protein
MQLVGPDAVFSHRTGRTLPPSAIASVADAMAGSVSHSASEKWRKKGFGKQFDENEGDNLWKQQSRRMALYIACNTE